MTITTAKIQLTEDGKTVYMLHYGDYEDKAVVGPYLGLSNIDFDSLSTAYRLERYAEKDAAKEDYCSLSEDDFIDWLLEKKVLQTVESVGINIDIRSAWHDPYVPSHWPQCPECSEGRGRPEYGSVRRSLNRLTTFNRCTECRNEWNYSEIPNNSNLPMLDDDGRDTVGGCVPFSISKACGLNFDLVLTACKRHGWNSSTGMFSNCAVIAARELGYELKRLDHFGTDSNSPPTLKQILAGLHDDRSYVIGVKNHWLAFVNGRIVDNDAATGLAKRVIEIYEVHQIEPQAA